MLILSEAQVRQCLSIENCLAANRIALGALRSPSHKKKKKLAGNAIPIVPPRIMLPRCYQQRQQQQQQQNNSKTSFLQTPIPIDTTLFKPAAFYYGNNDDVNNTHTPRNDSNDNDAQSEKSISSTGTKDHLSSTSASTSTSASNSAMLMGIKVVSVRSKNNSIGKPTVPATITMIDPETGEVNAVLGATYLTAARTAAGSAIATKLCMDSMDHTDTDTDTDTCCTDNDTSCTDTTDNEPTRNSNKVLVHQHGKHLVVFGAGLQAELHIRSIHHILPGQIHKVTIVNRTKPRAEHLHQLLSNDPDTRNLEYHLATLDDKHVLKHIVEHADIIVTAINCSDPLFDWRWVRRDSHCHINGVGSYLSSSEEVECTFVRDHCLTIADTMEALDVGDLKYIHEDSDCFVGLLGDLLEGGATIDGAKRQSKCTFFKSVGTAIQDIMTADDVVKTATRLGIGTNVEI